MALTFNKLSKPPTTEDKHEWYRWHYRIVELLNGLISVAIEHGSVENIEQADDTSSDAIGGKHVTDAQVKKYEDHRLIVDGNPHGTDHSQLDNVLGAGEYHITGSEATEIATLEGVGASEEVIALKAATDGVVVKTASGVYAGRTITGTTAEVTVTNGDGIAGDPVISLPTVIVSPRSFGDGTNQSTFELDGTLKCEGNATTWRDIDFPLIARVIGVGTPNYNTLLGNLNMLQWAVNDAEQCSSQEMVHQWKEGSQVVWHIHIVTGGTNVNDRYTQWSIEYTWGNVGTTFPATVTANSGDLLIPANTPFGTHLVYTVSTWTPTGGQIAAHVKARLKRIASVGTAPTANPFCEMIQLHIEQDTIGSRQVTSK